MVFTSIKSWLLIGAEDGFVDKLMRIFDLFLIASDSYIGRTMDTTINI